MGWFTRATSARLFSRTRMVSPGQYVSFNFTDCHSVSPALLACTFPWTETAFATHSVQVSASEAQGESQAITKLTHTKRLNTVGSVLFMTNLLSLTSSGASIRSKDSSIFRPYEPRHPTAPQGGSPYTFRR